jgi:hypothetical protein
MGILDAMISISFKIRLDAMSKVISFSISDRYLDKIRSLYPSLTDNLAAKQFLTDRLDEGLSSSLDASLDDGLEGKLKTLVESELDGILDERLDATVGKLIGDLSERLARLETRLDDGLDASLDGKLDDMEPLLKLQREASIASHPPDEPNSRLPVQKPAEPVEPVETDSSIESGTGAIEPATKTIPKTHSAIAKELGLKSPSTLTYWVKKGEIPALYQDRVKVSRDGKKIAWIGG